MARKFLIYVFVILFCVIFSLWLVLNSPYVQEKIKVIIQEKVVEEIGASIEIGKVSFGLPRTLSLHDVSFTDKLNWLKAEKISFKLNLKDLFEGKAAFAYTIKVAGNFKIYGNFNLSGAKTLDGTTIHFSLTPLSDLFKLSRTHFNPSGLVNFEGLINGTLTAPTFDLRTNIDDLNWENFSLKKVEAQATGSLFGSEILAHFSLRTQDQIGEVNGDFDFSYPIDGNLISLKSINLDTLGAKLSGSLEIDLQNLWPTGTLHAIVEDFKPLQIPGISDVKGSTNLTAQFSHPPLKQLAIDIQSQKIIQNEFTFKDVSLKTLHKLHPERNSHEFHLSIAKATHGKSSLKEVEAETTIDMNSEFWPFSIQSQKNTHDESLFFETSGSWGLQSESLQPDIILAKKPQSYSLFFEQLQNHGLFLDLEKLNAGVGPITLSLVNETTFKISKHKAELAPSLIQGLIGGGSIDLNIAYAQEKISGNMHLKKVDIANLLNANKSRVSLGSMFPVQGRMDGDISINGPLDDPAVSLQLHGSDLIYTDSISRLPKAMCVVNAIFEKEIFSCFGSLSALKDVSMQFNFLLPVFFSLAPFNFELKKETPLLGSVQIKGPLTPFLELATINTIPFSGNIDTKFELYGTIEAPHISGIGYLNEGFYEIPKIGIALNNISGKVEAKDSQLTFKDLHGNDSQGGSVAASGYLHLNPAEHYPFEFNMFLDDILLFHQDHVLAICKGPLAFKGNTLKAIVEGDLNLIKGQIKIPERPTAVVNSVDVIYINTPENEPPPQQITLKTSDWPINLNIDLNVPENLSIKGQGLRSLWKGSLKIQGNQDVPLLLGDLKIIDGQYLFNGNPFDISHGIITFAGDVDKKTTLYVTATKDLDRVKVDIIAKGSINNPEISFRSNPPLPQREILSWILFNRGTNEISPFQGTQLSESITNLKANTQGPDILTKIRSTFGIDRFEITRNSNSETDTEVNVQVGKYIAKDVLVSVIKSDVNSLAVEAALSNRVKLQAQVGDDAQGKLILKWKREY